MHHICTLSTDWLMFAQCWHMSAQYTCIDVLCNASNYSSYQTMQSSTKLFQDVSRYSAAQFWSLSPLASWTSQVGVDTQGPDWSNDGVVQSRPSCHLGCISDISRFAIRRTMDGENAWAPHCLMYSSASSFFSKTLPKLAQRSKLECQCGLMMTNGSSAAQSLMQFQPQCSPRPCPLICMNLLCDLITPLPKSTPIKTHQADARQPQPTNTATNITKRWPTVTNQTNPEKREKNLPSNIWLK